VLRWLDERLGLGPVLGALREKPVPVHRRSPFYLLGGAALFLMVLQFASGVLLAVYYHPTPEAAHGSVARLMSEVPFGWLVRSLHARGADLLVVMLLAHLASTYFLAAYRPPRELTWLTGMGLFFVMLAFCFSGSLLPWDTLAYFATAVGTEEVRTVPVIGETLLRVVRGGDMVGGPTLARFYVVHIVLLPLAALALVGLHVYLIQRHGISRPVGENGDAAVPFWPVVVLADTAVWVLLLGAVVVLAALLPRELGEVANPLASAPRGIRPEWYFTPAYETLRLVPGRIGGLPGPVVANAFFGLIALVWLAVPFWDRASARGQRSWLAWLVGVATVVWAVGITVYSYTRGS
jgi:cytochrome b6